MNFYGLSHAISQHNVFVALFDISRLRRQSHGPSLQRAGLAWRHPQGVRRNEAVARLAGKVAFTGGGGGIGRLRRNDLPRRVPRSPWRTSIAPARPQDGQVSTFPAPLHLRVGETASAILKELTQEDVLWRE